MGGDGRDLALLVDAKNALYRAIYAVRAPNAYCANQHVFTVFMRHLTSWMNLFRPTSVHICWDAPRETVWRRAILPTYKDRTASAYVASAASDIIAGTRAANAILQHLNVRQYYRKAMESDDLIYAAVTMTHPHRSVIVSTDTDMLQIPYVFGSAKVYNPRTEVTHDEITTVYNPAMLKALIGDTTDSVPGYLGIGPKRGAQLLEDHSKLNAFFVHCPRDIFERNLLLIDLSHCPQLLSNRLYMQKKMAEPVKYDTQAVEELAKQHKIVGLVSAFADLIAPFKELR